MKNPHPNYPKYFQFDPLQRPEQYDGKPKNDFIEDKLWERALPLKLGQQPQAHNFYLRYNFMPTHIEDGILFRDLAPIKNQDDEDTIFINASRSLISTYDRKVSHNKDYVEKRLAIDTPRSLLYYPSVKATKDRTIEDDLESLLKIEELLLKHKSDYLDWCNKTFLAFLSFHYDGFGKNPKDFLSHLQSIAKNKLTDSKHDQQLKYLIENFIESKTPAETVATPADVNKEKKKGGPTKAANEVRIENAKIKKALLIQQFTELRKTRSKSSAINRLVNNFNATVEEKYQIAVDNTTSRKTQISKILKDLK